MRSLPVRLARVGVTRSVEARRVQPVKHGRSQTFVSAHHVIFTVGFEGILRFGRRWHDSGEFQFAPCSLTLVRLSMTTGHLPIFSHCDIGCLTCSVGCFNCCSPFLSAAMREEQNKKNMAQLYIMCTLGFSGPLHA